MRKKIRVGKATDGLMGGYSNKPRYYAEIDDEDGESVVAKITTHDERNPKHKQKMEYGFRKYVKSFDPHSVIDKSLYVEKVDKSPIKTKSLDFSKRKFEFGEKESTSIRRFIFQSPTNRRRYCDWKIKKRSK